MNETRIPYGETSISLRQPPGTAIQVFCPGRTESVRDESAEVARAIQAPIGDVLIDQAKRARRVSIAISDKTRPVPYHAVLPPLLQRLRQAGVRDSSICILVGTGAHGPMSDEEMARMLPVGIFDRYQVTSHDARDPATLAFVGTTSRGTPIWVNRKFLEGEFRVVVGNVEPHQFAGFSGGAKGVVVGLGGLATIQANHAMMTHPQAELGRSTDNPVWEDIAEAGSLIGIDLAVNVVLDRRGRIAKAFAGAVPEAHKAAIQLCERVSRVEIPEPADVVIASPGGYPKDINFYQSQKALGHASRAVKQGGTVILVAECREGLGDSLFEEWMASSRSPHEILARFKREGFKLGAHKAYLVARDLVRAEVILVSQLPACSVRTLMMACAPSLENALEKALAKHGRAARVLALPRAASSVPVLR